MVDGPVTIGDVSLDEPHRPGPDLFDLPQRGMASAALPEPVRPARKARLVDRLQQQADHLADQLLWPRWQPERPELPVLLRDVDAAGRGEPVPLMSHQLDDLVNRSLGHAVGGFLA